MSTYTSTTPFVSASTIDDAVTAYDEHAAYKEFECLTGQCDTCDELLQAIEDQRAKVSTLDCDGCGTDVLLTTHPRDLVIVLCRACNGGVAIA